MRVRVSLGAVALALCLAAALLPSGAAAVKRRKVNFAYDAALVPTIGAPDFREKVMDPTLPVVVQFFDPTSPTCEEFGAEFVTAVKALEGHALFRALDGTSEEGKQLGQMFGVQSMPTTLLFNPEMLAVEGQPEGSYMKIPAVLPGKQSAKRVVQWVLEFSAGHEIDRLADLGDWKDFADRYQALELPKVILVTAGNVTSPLFKTVSHEFRYGAQFAVVHGADLAEAAAAARGAASMTMKGELLAHLGLGAKPDLDRLPSLTLVTGTAANPDIEVLRNVADADFGLAELKAAVARVAWPEARRRETMSYFLEDAQRRRKQEAELAKQNRALPPITAYEAAAFEEHCVRRKKGVCALVFVEDTEDEAALSWLESASRKMAQRSSTPSRLVVISGPQQPELASFFRATDTGFPTVVFINPGRRQFHNLIGSFSERGVVSFFVDRALKSKGRAYDPKKVPAFVEPKAADEGAGDGDAAGDGDDIVVQEDL